MLQFDTHDEKETPLIFTRKDGHEKRGQNKLTRLTLRCQFVKSHPCVVLFEFLE